MMFLRAFPLRRSCGCIKSSQKTSPLRGKLIQAHDAPRLNPAWVHNRWVQTRIRLCIQAENERLFQKKEEALERSLGSHTADWSCLSRSKISKNEVNHALIAVNMKTCFSNINILTDLLQNR